MSEAAISAKSEVVSQIKEKLQNAKSAAHAGRRFWRFFICG